MPCSRFSLSMTHRTPDICVLCGSATHSGKKANLPGHEINPNSLALPMQVQAYKADERAAAAFARKQTQYALLDADDEEEEEERMKGAAPPLADAAPSKKQKKRERERERGGGGSSSRDEGGGLAAEDSRGHGDMIERNGGEGERSRKKHRRRRTEQGDDEEEEAVSGREEGVSVRFGTGRPKRRLSERLEERGEEERRVAARAERRRGGAIARLHAAMAAGCRPVDLQVIDCRLREKAYGKLPSDFVSDVRQVGWWRAQEELCCAAGTEER